MENQIRIPSEVIDQIEFEIQDLGAMTEFAIPMDCKANVDFFLAISAMIDISRRKLNRLAKSVHNHQGLTHEDSGYRYGTEEYWPGEEEFESVWVYSMHDDVYVDTDAFDRMMLRFFREAIRVANETNDKVLTEPWWPEFLQNVEIISERCNPTK